MFGKYLWKNWKNSMSKCLAGWSTHLHRKLFIYFRLALINSSENVFSRLWLFSIGAGFGGYSSVFGTDSDQNRITWGNPQKWCSDSLPFLMGHLGVGTPYATRRKLQYEANQVWMNTTFISQGPQSSGKLAVKTWRVKTELIIITILHIIIVTTSILNLGFKTFAPKILAHTTCKNRYLKYTQIFAAKSSKTYCKKQAKLIAK